MYILVYEYNTFKKKLTIFDYTLINLTTHHYNRKNNWLLFFVEKIFWFVFRGNVVVEDFLPFSFRFFRLKISFWLSDAFLFQWDRLCSSGAFDFDRKIAWSKFFFAFSYFATKRTISKICFCFFVYKYFSSQPKLPSSPKENLKKQNKSFY